MNASLQLTPRDINILKTLFECRIATYAHLAVLHFGGSVDAAKKRVHRLRTDGWLAARARAINYPLVFALTDQSLNYLRDHDLLIRYPHIAQVDLYKRRTVADATLQHELAVMDLRCAMQVRFTESLFEIQNFSTWPLLHSFHARADRHAPATLVRPDAFFSVRSLLSARDRPAPDSEFFIELDRATEALATLVVRCRCYRDFYLAGGFAKWHNASRDQYDQHPFRILLITTSAERRNNLAEQLWRLPSPILYQVWLTTLDEALRDPLGAIWITPADHRAAVRGTEFDGETILSSRIYRRRVARESLLAARLRPRTLF